jgi:hypothetical protein
VQLSQNGADLLAREDEGYADRPLGALGRQAVAPENGAMGKRAEGLILQRR